jgi:short-subunit dehydrogenase
MREPRTNGSSEPHRHPQRCDGSSPDSGRRGLGPNEDDRCQRTDEDHHTEGLYSELKDSPVAVTVDFPGGVATDITGNSGVRTPEVSGDTGTAAAKLATPMDAAQQIVAGVERGSYRVVIGKDARMLDRLSQLAQKRATDLIARKMAALVGE